MGRTESITSQRTATLSPRASVPALERPATGLLVLPAGVSFVAHMVVAGNYGYFRVELYYIADGRHLQAGYVDQPLLMGWLAAVMRVVAGDGLVAIHVIPALACALIVVITGLMARELGGGRVAQLVAGVAALFALAFDATGSLFSMDVLDQLWWALASVILLRLLRRQAPRLWLGLGVVLGIALLTKLTVLFFGLALFLALLVTPERRFLRTPWPYLAGGITFLGLLPYLVWNALNGWPTWAFWHHYGGVDTSPPAFLGTQLVLMNPIAVPLAVAGLVFYFRPVGADPRAGEHDPQPGRRPAPKDRCSRLLSVPTSPVRRWPWGSLRSTFCSSVPSSRVLDLAARPLSSDQVQEARSKVQLRKRPLMAGRILCCILPLTILEVPRFHDDSCAMPSCLFAVGGYVGDAHHDRVRGLTAARWTPFSTDISHDDRAITKDELRPMVFANPDALDEAEGPAQPVDGLSYVRVGQDGNHRGVGDGAIRLQV